MNTVTTGYDAAVAEFLAEMVELAYTQYAQGLSDPTYDGGVVVPPGYKQVAAFKSVEIDPRADSAAMRTLGGNLTGQQGLSDRIGDTASLSATLTKPGALDALTVGRDQVFFGFALQATTAEFNVISIRGTRSVFEWVEDALGVQVPVPLAWYVDGKFQLARAHLGFLVQFALLVDQVEAAAKVFDNGLPVVVTGHSLGSALATLASAMLGVQDWLSGAPVVMYAFASPRVGNPVFVDAFDAFVPQAFRIANLSDIVPILPPTSVTVPMGGADTTYVYGDCGEEWSYLWQTGDVGGNHALATNYLPAAQAAIATDAARAYPVTGL